MTTRTWHIDFSSFAVFEKLKAAWKDGLDELLLFLVPQLSGTVTLFGVMLFFFYGRGHTVGPLRSFLALAIAALVCIFAFVIIAYATNDHEDAPVGISLFLLGIGIPGSITVAVSHPSLTPVVCIVLLVVGAFLMYVVKSFRNFFSFIAAYDLIFLVVSFLLPFLGALSVLHWYTRLL